MKEEIKEQKKLGKEEIKEKKEWVIKERKKERDSHLILQRLGSDYENLSTGQSHWEAPMRCPHVDFSPEN